MSQPTTPLRTAGWVVASSYSHTCSLNPADEDGRIRGNVRNYTASRTKKKQNLQNRRCQNLKWQELFHSKILYFILYFIHNFSFEIWCWRRMEKISWTDHVRNEEVLLRVKGQRIILHETSKRKANWIGYILCRNCL